MLTPSENSRLKRKKIETKTETQTQTHCREEEKEQHVDETVTSENGVVAMLHSPQGHHVRSCAIFTVENPSLKKGLVGKTMLQEIDESVGSEEEYGSAMVGLAGIPLAPCSQSTKVGVYFVLEKASLVAAYVGKKYQILNPDEHATFLRRKNKNPYDYRPDIVHEALLQIMGSRLCMAGRLRAVFIRTDEGILIKVEPNTQIPKTLGSFCNLMAELLQKFSIKSKGNHGKLLRLIENPVTQHLPVNSRKIGLSVTSPKAVQINDYIAATNHDENLVFVVGAMAHGKIDAEYIDDLISVSALPLSAGTCLRRICVALERNWKIH